MDYQRNGWFRPTCGIARQTPTPYRMANEPRMGEEHKMMHEHKTEPMPCHDTWEITATSLAIVWSPEQAWRKVYEPTKALSRGTLFVELDKPFTGKC